VWGRVGALIFSVVGAGGREKGLGERVFWGTKKKVVEMGTGPHPGGPVVGFFLVWGGGLGRGDGVGGRFFGGGFFLGKKKVGGGGGGDSKGGGGRDMGDPGFFFSCEKQPSGPDWGNWFQAISCRPPPK